MVIRKNLANRVVVEKRFNLIDYLYVITLNVKDLDQKTRLPLRRIRIVNVYDQFIGRGYTFLGAYVRKRRVIKDVN